MKKLSIVTINYNNAQGLKKTLDSVAAQSCTDFEHVIVDGASTDGSVDVIKEYESAIKNQQSSIQLQWVSEPDKGIYNAMNKGIEIAMGKRKINEFNRSEHVEDKNKGIEIAMGKRKINEFNRSELVEDKNKGIEMATGEYLLFLNSGDALENPDVVKNFLAADVTADVATGIERMPNGQLIPAPKNEMLTYAFFYEDTLLHQSTFIRKDAFERFGLYREDYRIVSDWEWFFRAIVRDGVSYQPLDFVVADFDGEGMSNDAKHHTLQDKEREQVHQEILPRVRPNYDELLQKRKEALEFEHLKNGKFGPIVKLFLIFKSKKQRSIF